MEENKNKSHKTEICPYCKMKNENIIKALPSLFTEIKIIHKKCWKTLWKEVYIQLAYEDYVPRNLKRINKWAELKASIMEDRNDMENH